MSVIYPSVTGERIVITTVLHEYFYLLVYKLIGIASNAFEKFTCSLLQDNVSGFILKLPDACHFSCGSLDVVKMQMSIVQDHYLNLVMQDEKGLYQWHKSNFFVR